MSSSIYELPSSKLPDASKCIRLVRIHSGEDEDEISCSVVIASLAAAPEYAALSYTWGEPDPIRTISIDGVTVGVRENCRYALWQLRRQPALQFLLIWIDAICIN